MQPRERLNEMLVRSEKATEGPWEAMDYSDPRYATGYPGVGSHAAKTYILQPGFTSDSDTNFIAAARTDLPATAKCLLAVMDELKHGKESELGNGYVATFAAMVENIINRELGAT